MNNQDNFVVDKAQLFCISAFTLLGIYAFWFTTVFEVGCMILLALISLLIPTSE